MRIVVTLLAVAGLSFAVVSLAGEKGRLVRSALGYEDRPAEDRYLTAAVARGSIRRSITATGPLQALATVEVSSQLSGQIASLEADFNQALSAGGPLAILDQRGYRSQVRQAQAELAMAKEQVAVLAAKLEKARALEAETLAGRGVQAARVEQAKIKLATANRSLEQTETLAQRGTKSKNAVADAKDERDTAAAALREARAAAKAQAQAIETSKAGRREAEAELARARAAVPLADAALDLAELDLDRSTIRSPVNGVVIDRRVEEGQTVAASLDAPTLFTIAGDLGEMEIHANVDETDIGQIRVGQFADFSVDAYPGHRFLAQVTELRRGARILQGVVSYTVVLSVENPEWLLLPGMTAKIKITVQEEEDVLTLPLAALRFSPDDRPLDASAGLPGALAPQQRTVWVWNEASGLRPVEIEIGIDDGRDVLLRGDALEEGAAIVVGKVAVGSERSLFGLQL